MAEPIPVGTGMSAVRALRTSPIQQQVAVQAPVQAPVQVPLIPSDIPYDTKTATQIKSFYRFQRKKPDQYKKGEDGSLNLYKKDGSLETSIQLKSYRPITSEERDDMERFRLEKLAALDVIYEEKRRVLLKAYADYKTTGNALAVVRANGEVNTVELQRVQARSAVRGVKQIPVPKTNEVMFDEPYEQRKLFGASEIFGGKDILNEGIFVLERRNFPASLFYGRYENFGAAVPTQEGATGTTEGEATVRLTTGMTARLFFQPEDPQNGIFSPLWPVDFVYKETQYSSAFQAYEASRMEEQGQMEVRAKILKTRSARTIGIQTRKFPAPAKNPQALWTGILTDLYAQHPELAEKLVQTGQDALVYADPVAGGGGVGLSADNTKILDPANWKGENIVGRVLESVRAGSRETGAAEAAPPPEAKEKVISVEEQEAAKKAAIIRAKRGGN
jgi:ribA/ribD-fused uncharacterized protein